MRIDLPGIGGSLGQCVLCGECFAAEVIFGRGVPMISIDGFARDLPVHQKCVEKMQALKSPFSWENLPEGPLRREYAEAIEKSEAVSEPK